MFPKPLQISHVTPITVYTLCSQLEATFCSSVQVMRKFLMSWEEQNERWVKRCPTKFLEVSGCKYFKVSCRQLKAPPTKIGSYKQANNWWRATLLELHEKLNQQTENKYAEELEIAETLEQMAHWLRERNDFQEADRKVKIAQRVRRAIRLDQPPLFSEREVWALSEWDTGEDDEADAEWYARATADTEVWVDRIRSMSDEPTPSHQTVGYWVNDFLVTITPATNPSSLHNIRRQVNVFRDWIGESISVSEINETTVKEYNRSLHRKDYSPATRRDCFSSFRRFIHYLCDHHLIELPRNLNSKEFSFRVAYVPKVATKTDILQALGSISQRRDLKLYALLALNCGMNNADIGLLYNTRFQWQEAVRQLTNNQLDCGHVDWNEGRIVRRRVKTKAKANMPTVCYKLWDETFSLLKSFRSSDERYCLVTEGGATLYFYGEKRKDLIGQLWRRNVTNGVTFKQLRSGGATLLGSHPEFGRYANHYLADSPRSIADKHYVQPDQKRFDAAIEWLGEQLNIT